MHYDIIIVGGGPIGLACGLAAQKAGLQYLIVEKGALVNSLYHYPANMTFFSTSERLEIGGIPFVSNNAKPTRSEALEYYRRVAESQQLNLHLYETVQKLSGATPLFTVETDKTTYTAQFIILATGFFDVPVLLNIPGEDLPKVTHYYGEPHAYYRQKVIVVGANNSAVDAALEIWRKGAEVTMVIREAEIGKRVKYWARPDIVNRIEEGAIRAYFQSELAAVRPDEVDVRTPEGVITLPNDFVIAATGYQPNFGFLERIGVQLSPDEKRYPSYNPDTQESNVPGLYLAGVVCGGMDTHVWFIENSRVHADRIVENIKILLLLGDGSQ
ncbi:MAG: YpdA family putative bacillithiol disulfide reductase [Saprospiraceae bacterium]|nr:YpdA family putative bacillithiol disulfide reductase [Saprospiraceae bacterium]